MTGEHTSEKQIPPTPEGNTVFTQVRQEIKQFGAIIPVHERALPALRLYAYNYLSGRSAPLTEKERESFQEICIGINNEEALHAQTNDPLCTIGLELEAFFTPEIRSILQELDIPLIKEDDPSHRLWEVMLPWTYSAKTQTFMLNQLVAMNALQPPLGEEESLRRQRKRRIGMHLNFAIPKDLTERDLDSDRTQRAIGNLNDALIIAYVSPDRIEQRKTSTLYTSDKAAEPTNKTPTDQLIFRLELRAFEFTQPLADTLLIDSQRLATALFQWIRKYVSPTENLLPLLDSLAEEFDLFSKEVEISRNKFLVLRDFTNKYHDVDKELENLVLAKSILSNRELRKAFKDLVSETSARLGDFLRPEEDDE